MLRDIPDHEYLRLPESVRISGLGGVGEEASPTWPRPKVSYVITVVNCPVL